MSRTCLDVSARVWDTSRVCHVSRSLKGADTYTSGRGAESQRRPTRFRRSPRKPSGQICPKCSGHMSKPRNQQIRIPDLLLGGRVRGYSTRGQRRKDECRRALGQRLRHFRVQTTQFQDFGAGTSGDWVAGGTPRKTTSRSGAAGRNARVRRAAALPSTTWGSAACAAPEKPPVAHDRLHQAAEIPTKTKRFCVLASSRHWLAKPVAQHFGRAACFSALGADTEGSASVRPPSSCLSLWGRGAAGAFHQDFDVAIDMATASRPAFAFSPVLLPLPARAGRRGSSSFCRFPRLGAALARFRRSDDV